MIPRSYPFSHYLAAKKRVDDRALNRRVWGTMARALPTADKDAPLQVLEVGSGIGTMIERTLEWSLLTHAHYTAIDAQPENLSHTRQRLRDWGQGKGYQIRTDQDGLKMSRLGPAPL